MAMEDVIRISRLAKELGVSAQYIRMLESQGRIPPARRDFNGRIYTQFDIELLRAMGVGNRPEKLKRAEEVLGVRGE